MFWKPYDDPCWKQVCREPPPTPKNKAPVRVFYNHNRDKLYRSFRHGHACMNKKNITDVLFVHADTTTTSSQNTVAFWMVCAILVKKTLI